MLPVYLLDRTKICTNLNRLIEFAIPLNTVELLKRAALERKKSDGAYRERSTSSNHTSQRSCSWDVFPYDLLPNQLRPADLLLGQVSNFTRLLH